jgi:hypothetical protein
VRTPCSIVQLLCYLIYWYLLILLSRAVLLNLFSRHDSRVETCCSCTMVQLACRERRDSDRFDHLDLAIFYGGKFPQVGLNGGKLSKLPQENLNSAAVDRKDGDQKHELNRISCDWQQSSIITHPHAGHASMILQATFRKFAIKLFGVPRLLEVYYRVVLCYLL